MKLIVGLGNPGKKYEKNRHNLGFMVAEVFATEQGLTWKKNRDLMCFFAKTREYVFIKPTTYMNESGQSVRAVCEYYGIDSGDVLIICDDLDLDFGKIRLSFNGSSAGHHGIESVTRGLGGPEFARLRIGIGRPSPAAPDSDGKPSKNPTDYVLEDFSKEEREKLPEIIAKCQEAVLSYLDEGIEATMNRFN